MAITYQFHVSERIVFAEIYFPKRAVYYGPIFTALSEGYDEENVKTYMRERASLLLRELQEYPVLLDPTEYETDIRSRKARYTIKDALTRIDMYRSPFQGWSTYSGSTPEMSW